MPKATITSYFSVIPKSKTGESSAASSNKKHKLLDSDEDKEKSVSPKKRHKPTKRKKPILSDSEDEVVVAEHVSRNKQAANGDKTKRARDSSSSKSPTKPAEPPKRNNKRHVLSDSEDEVVEVKPKSKETARTTKDKVVPRKTVSANDVFSSKPVKRTKVLKPPKNVMEEGLFYDDALEVVLDQVEKSVTRETVGKINGGNNLGNSDVRNSVNKTGSQKENTKVHNLSDSDESIDDKTEKTNKRSRMEKDSEKEEVISKHFQSNKTDQKNGATTTSKTSDSSKASGSSQQSSDDKLYKKGISKIEIDQTAGQKRKRDDGEKEVDLFEERIQKKKRGAVLYQQYLQRGGARNPGSKEIPTGARNCLAGLTFLVTGVLDSMERDEVDELIKKYGGRVVAQVSKKTNYLILGDEPGPAKLQKANQLGVKTISEDELLEMIRTRPAGQATNESKNLIGKKSPRKAKRKTPEPEPLTSTNPDPSTKAERSEKTSSKAAENKSKSFSNEKPSTSKVMEVTKRSDIPPVIRVPSAIGSQVWVEKYRPKNMKQIIGQQGDKSNARKLHFWLQNWQKNQSGKVKLTRPSPWAQTDGAFFKAALLSGPPGVGKTTTVQVVCDALGFDALEFNASDTRSKRLLKEEVSELLNNKSMKGYFIGGQSKKPDLNHVLVMDEVDGMAGNEDRGGLQELIALIKTTNVPIICICNDRNNPKMRTLSNYTFDLKFQKPRIEQIKSAMMSVCFREDIKIAPDDLNRLIESTNCDVRQVLNHLSLLCDNPSLDDTSKTRRVNKDLRLGPWDVVQKVFTHEAHKTMSIHDKSDLFFHDYNIAPLFVQENYLSVVPNCPKNKVLERVADSAESLALGDLVENAIRRNGAWALLPTQACYSSVIPGTLMSGHISRQIVFPSWLGRNSTRGKFDRLLQEITIHTRLATMSSKDSINLDYLKHLRDAVVRPLVTNGADGASAALEAMNYYHLLREDLDSLAEVSLWPGDRDPMQALDSKVKAAFTRAFNKSSIMRPYALTKGAEKKKRGQAANSEEMDFDEEELQSEDEDDSPSSDPMIKVKKAPITGSKKSEKGATGSKKKGSSSRGGKSK